MSGAPPRRRPFARRSRGNYRPEHVFALRHALELYDVHQAKIAECDTEIEAVLRALNEDRATPAEPLPAVRHAKSRNEPNFDARPALYTLLGADLTQIHGFGPYTVLRLIGECGDDMRKWPTAKHFTSWLSLAPGNKISGGRLLSSKTRRSSNRAAALLRIAAVNIGRTQTALGAFYRRLAARIGKAKAVTATARKLAVLFYNALRFGMAYVDPGASYYEERYRQRVIDHLHRRARHFGFTLVEAPAERGSFLGKRVRSARTGAPWATAGRAHFIRDMQALNVRPPDKYPRATDVVPEIVTAVRALVARGLAYESGGSVYFRVDAWPDFGQLSHLRAFRDAAGGQRARQSTRRPEQTRSPRLRAVAGAGFGRAGLGRARGVAGDPAGISSAR